MKALRSAGLLAALLVGSVSVTAHADSMGKMSGTHKSGTMMKGHTAKSGKMMTSMSKCCMPGKKGSKMMACCMKGSKMTCCPKGAHSGKMSGKKSGKMGAMHKM